MTQYKNYASIAVLILSISFAACRKENKTTTLNIGFSHSVGNKAFIQDSLQYVNAAGNHYEVNDLQYFISEVILHKSDGENVAIITDNGIHYVDIDIPGTLSWNIGQQIPTGNYTSVSFTFGINEAKNKTGLFLNPPQRDMFWPDPMGGGYHYLKMNGQWVDTLDELMLFNFHIGIGMMEGMGFVQNYFTVNVPNSGANLTSDADQKLLLNMDIASWFETPILWDWNTIGGSIMQNQGAMHMACENGADAFSCKWSNN
ncbi:MAG: MbnP family protein [Bacteroidales bacterium]